MLRDYIEKKLASAKYKVLEDKTYFGEIPKMRGVWANAKTLSECKMQLREVFEEWVLFRLRNGKAVSGLNMQVDPPRLAAR